MASNFCLFEQDGERGHFLFEKNDHRVLQCKIHAGISSYFGKTFTV